LAAAVRVLDVPGRAVQWFAALPPYKQGLLLLAFTVLFVELAFRRFAPRSRAYAKWTAFFQKVGHVWSIVILSIIYFLSVALVSVGMRLFGKDPLDRSLDPEPSFWKSHEPNPLGPMAAARHQF
jgi:hypothetical protein